MSAPQAKKLTRQGARNLTKHLDLVADAIEKNAGVLGVHPAVVQDFIKKADLFADAIELTAAQNFPLDKAAEEADKIPADADPEVQGVSDTSGGKMDESPKSKDQNKPETYYFGGKKASPDWATAAKDETGTSVSPNNGGWDPNAIGDDVGGPYAYNSDEASYMAGHFAQNWFQQLRDKVESNTVPRLGQVDKFAAAGMAMSACLRDVGRVAQVGKMADAEYRDHIQQLAEIDRLIAETQAEIVAVAGDLNRKSTQLTAAQKKVFAGFDGLVNTLKSQSEQVVEIRGLLLDCTKLVSGNPPAGDVSMAEAAFSADVREAIDDLWDAVQKEGSGFQRAVAKLQYSAGIMDFLHSVEEFSTNVWGALERLFDMGSAAISGAKDRVSKSFSDLKSAYAGAGSEKTAANESEASLLRRLLAEEGMSHLAEDKSEDKSEDEAKSEDEDKSEDEEGKTAGINLFE